MDEFIAFVTIIPGFLEIEVELTDGKVIGIANPGVDVREVSGLIEIELEAKAVNGSAGSDDQYTTDEFGEGSDGFGS